MTVYQLVDLTGDGHGQHIAGTPFVYRHGWHPINTGGVKVKPLAAKHLALTAKNKRSSAKAIVRTFQPADEAKPGAFPTAREVLRKQPDPSGDRKIVSKFVPTMSTPSLAAAREHDGKTLPLKAKATPGAVPTGERRVLSRKEVRASLTMTNENRNALLVGAGLTAGSKADDVDIIHQLHATLKSGDTAKKDALTKEVEDRMKALNVAFATIKEADLLAQREKLRGYYRKFDASLGRTKMGEALLKMRDKVISDGTFDRVGATYEHAKEYGKDWAKHLATSRIVQTLTGSAVALAAHHLGGSASGEMVGRFMENPVAEAGIAAAVTIGLGLTVKGIIGLHKKHKAKHLARLENRPALEDQDG